MRSVYATLATTLMLLAFSGVLTPMYVLMIAAVMGLVRPSDIGMMTPEGELALLGRAGRFVKIAGRRLNLAEIEQALKRVAGVRDAFVVAHAERADALAAAVATDHSADLIRTALRERLATWKIPKKLVLLPAFPITVRGKTDTAKLRQILSRREREETG